MRELTFKSYLKNHVKEISDSHSLDIAKLVVEAANGNTALYEPLVLYCMLCDKESAFLKAVAKVPNFDRSYILANVTEKDLVNKKSLIPENYKKVYETYREIRVGNKISHEYKEQLRKKIVSFHKKYKLPLRKISLAVEIDPSNLNAFVKNKEYSKISPDKLEKIVEYLESQK